MSKNAKAAHQAPILPIYPDDVAPIREGYKIPLHQVDGGKSRLYDHAFFPDSVYGSTEAAYEAAEAWLNQEDVDVEDTRNVVRIEIPEIEDRIKRRRATYGWQVRMRRQGKSYTHFFNDNHFGGKEGSLRAAQYWRNWRDASLTKTDPREAIEKSRQTRSQFGVPGLRVLLVDVGGGSYKPYLQASWPVRDAEGEVKRKRKMYSLEKHDPKKAVVKLCQMLVKARQESTLSESELSQADSPFSVLEPETSSAVETGELEAFEASLKKSIEAYRGRKPAPKANVSVTTAEAPVRVAQQKMFMRLYNKALPAVEALLPKLTQKAEAMTAAAQQQESDC